MEHEELETLLRTGSFPHKRWQFTNKEQMKLFVGNRKATIELTDLECDIAKSSARRKAEGRGKYYGDFAVGNFTTGTKGEMAVAKYLHSIKPFKDLSRAVDLSRKEYGDGGVDIHWGRWRIDVKTTGTKYGALVCNSSEPRFGQANLLILAHLRFDGMEKVEGTRTLRAKKNLVDLYGFLTTAEFYESDSENMLVRASHYGKLRPPEEYFVDCWMLRPIRDLQPDTTA